MILKFTDFYVLEVCIGQCIYLGVGNKCIRVKGHGRISQMTSLKIIFITRIILYREKQSLSNRKETDYVVEVFKIKFNIKLSFKVQKQPFADVLQNSCS